MTKPTPPKRNRQKCPSCREWFIPKRDSSRTCGDPACAHDWRVNLRYKNPDTLQSHLISKAKNVLKYQGDHGPQRIAWANRILDSHQGD